MSSDANALGGHESDVSSDEFSIVEEQEAEEKPLVQISLSPAVPAALSIKDKASDTMEGQITSVMSFLSKTPSRQRTVALVGVLHSGKTSIAQLLTGGFQLSQQETDRCISLRTVAHTTLTSGERYPAPHILTVLDTPGHPDMHADMCYALRMADTALLCVDATDSSTSQLERIVRQIVLVEEMPLILFITKLDKLILDLHVRPVDAYYKAVQIIDSINNMITTFGHPKGLLSPIAGNVCFVSAKLELFFTVGSFAEKYASSFPGVDPAILATRLWGPIVYNSQQRRFVRQTRPDQLISFATFVLEPLYKVIAHSIAGKGSRVLTNELTEKPDCPLSAALEAVRYFAGEFGKEALDALLSNVPPSMLRNKALLHKYNLGAAAAEDGVVAVSALADLGDEQAPNMCILVRILHGRVARGQKLTIITTGSDDDGASFTVDSIFVKSPKGLFSVSTALPGMIVALPGLSKVLAQPHALFLCDNAILALSNSDDDFYFSHIYSVRPLCHVALEPWSGHVNVLREGLGILMLKYPGISVECEETGAYVLTGYGELQLEAALCDLRRLYCKDFPLKVTPPYVSFSETVEAVDNGVLAAYPEGPSADPLMMVSKRLTLSVETMIENNQLPLEGDILRQTLRREGWDCLSSTRGILAVSYDRRYDSYLWPAANVLSDDSISNKWPDEDSVVEGFSLAMRSGPLCAEPVRGVHVNIISDYTASATPTAESVARCTTLSLLGAYPRLLEPIMMLDIITPPRHIPQITRIIEQHRGNMCGESPMPLTLLVIIKARVPLIDCLGLETIIRNKTDGEAFPSQQFEQWELVPGDAYEKAVSIEPGQVAKGDALARDFVSKTRARKGMKEIFESW